MRKNGIILAKHGRDAILTKSKMRTRIPCSWYAPCLLALSLALPHAASASVTYVGSATGSNGATDRLSAEAIFFLPGDTDGVGDTCSGVAGTLCVTLINTQSGGTQNRSDLLDALYFSVLGNPTLTDVSAVAGVVLRPNSTNTPVLSVAPQSSPLAGGWALDTTPGTDTVNPSLPTSGYAWTTVGNSGAFNSGALNVGNDDYGLISGTNVSAIGGNIPVISNTLFLVLSGFNSGSSSLPLTSISGVVFTWNSTGQYSATGTSQTPEPTSFWMIAMALVSLGTGRRVLDRLRK